MLSSHLFAKRALLCKQTGARFFSLNASALQTTAQGANSHTNFAQFFAGVKPSEVAGSDVQSVANLLKVLSYASESHEAETQTELYSAIDEFFRGKFRKLSANDALTLLTPLSESPEQRLTLLDDKFWVWETLDEALRPAIPEITEEEVLTLVKVYGANFKGSEDLWDFLNQRVYLHGRPSPF